METAKLHFRADGTPVSAEFDDVYFSTGHGIEESTYVFIEQNKLPQRFSELSADDHFTVAETGFGTGLNFLLVWQTFLKHAPSTARLTFVSCEKYPLTPTHLSAAHTHRPSLKDLSQALISQYPPELTGFHLLEFDRVNCVLMYGDAVDVFSELTASVDAWFLDGFAPSKNPDMWRAELFGEIARLSHLKTTLATFTAARIVREGLTGVGFQLEKTTGYGRKRHMLRGRFKGISGPHEPKVWPSSELAFPQPLPGKKTAIVGAGIAALTTAVELKKRGYEVTIFDQHPEAANGGSGNLQGAVYAKLAAKPTTSNQFYAQALIKAQAALKHLPDSVPHKVTGLIQLVHDERESKRLTELTDTEFIPESLAVELASDALTELAGIDIQDRGLWFPDGGWVSPQSWVNHLLSEGDFTTVFNTKIDDVELKNSGWLLHSAAQRYGPFDHVIFATAFDTQAFEKTAHLPLNPLAGQITQLESQPHHKALKAVICTDRYVMPLMKGQLTVGSTFRVKSTDTTLRDEEHRENIENLSQRLPGFLSRSEKIVGGRAATRCNAPDYLPMVGPVSEPESLKEQFRIPLQRNRAQKEPAASHWPGLWVNVAHGSKGLCSSHLSAKYLAAMINAEPHPIQATLAKALNPNRFVIRALLREKRKKL